MYWKGKYEGLHENQQSLNTCVKNISDMGKMALKVSFRGMHAYLTELK